MKWPVLLDHNQDKVLGFVSYDGGKLIATFYEGVTKDMVWETLGNCGIRMLDLTEENGKIKTTKVEIYEWSIPSHAYRLRDEPEPV